MVISHSDIDVFEDLYSNDFLQDRYRYCFGRDLKMGQHCIGRILLMETLLRKGIPLHLCRTIKYNQEGKPFFRDNDIYFNIAHSKSKVACAVSLEEPIGIDLEYTSHRIGIKDVLSILCQAEIDHIKKSSKNEIVRIWTRKESFIKAIGLGFAINLRNVNTLEDKLAYNGNSWIFNDLNWIPGYQMSVCSKSGSYPENNFVSKITSLQEVS